MPIAHKLIKSILMNEFRFPSQRNAPPTLRNISMNVKDGQIVAIVGSVGSGKSSLISALLGEMKTLTGLVNTKGKIAYVPQQAWLQNATLKYNITFGKKVNKELYDKVLEVSKLLQTSITMKNKLKS